MLVNKVTPTRPVTLASGKWTDIRLTFVIVFWGPWGTQQSLPISLGQEEGDVGGLEAIVYVSI